MVSQEILSLNCHGDSVNLSKRRFLVMKFSHSQSLIILILNAARNHPVNEHGEKTNNSYQNKINKYNINY